MGNRNHNDNNIYNLRPFLEKDRLTGENFSTWERLLRLVMKSEGREDVINTPFLGPLSETSTVAEVKKHKEAHDRAVPITFLMIATMEPSLQKRFEDQDAAEPALEIEDPLPIKYNNMAEQTLKELGAPKTGEDPLCIVFPELENPLKLNSCFLNLLPKLYGNADPAKEWLYEQLPSSSINSWAELEKNTKQFSTRNDVKSVNEIDISGIHNQLQENSQQIATLTTLVSKIASNESKSRVCGVCSDFSHATDECPTLQSEDVNALGGFSGQKNRKYDPFSQTYNEGWKDHPNLRYGNRPQFQQFNQFKQHGQQNPPPKLLALH
uniref:Uncharacterized protein n=1 Tax=Chenopodium quinoa TaxID=63459 RepID=A0A803LJ15_CHEQI